MNSADRHGCEHCQFSVGWLIRSTRRIFAARAKEVVVGSVPIILFITLSFFPAALWNRDFSDANGWKGDPAYWDTIEFPDVDGSGYADVCGRGEYGIWCATSNGLKFSSASLWVGDFDDANGWKADPAYWATIRFADVNGDGRADVCGRGEAGIHCAISSGSNFSPPTLWNNFFSDANGWKTDLAYWGTIRFPDINGDGYADVCGRGEAGIYCATSDCSKFSSASLWVGNFADASGWKADPAYWGTIRFADVNGDGRADVCGRGEAGIHCAVSSGSNFSTATLWNSFFSDAIGWKGDQSYWGTIRFPDVNGDGKADICGRGESGIHCATSNGAAFAARSLWNSDFSDANGWKGDQAYWGTIRFPNLNSDDRADLCGRGELGIWCAASNGASFSSTSRWAKDFTDAGGWKEHPSYWATIDFPNVNGNGYADVCGRGNEGIWCAITKFSIYLPAVSS